MTRRRLTITAPMVACWLLAGSCAVDDRDLEARAPVGNGGTQSGNGAGAAPSEPEELGAEVYPGEPTGQEGLPALGGIQPVDVVSGGAASCRGDAGACTAAGEAGTSVPCVPTGLRDCTSDLDNDCDGLPDNTVDDVCACTPGSEEPCDEHPGLDGRGQCQPGARTCIVGSGNLTSDWSACEGAVGPGEEDSCSVPGDDTNCDGTDNGGCPCVEGEARPCGPDTENGICQPGTQTCVNGGFGQCEGAVFPAARNCGSQQDNDCDGLPDNTVDNVCTCAIGSVQACGAHPGRDGNGPCQAGSQTCAGRANNSTSGFGACAGSVGPAAQDTCAQGNDANCNGLTNEGCACVNGNTRACGPDTDVGVCQRGSQTCVNGGFDQCQGAVFPAPRNCGSQQDNDCDGRPDNTLDNVCQCRPGQGNAPCSADANNSRCNAQGQCVACQTDADCSLVSGGRDSCDGGRCVVDLLPDGETCQANNECASGPCTGWARDGDGDGFGRQNTFRRTCGTAAPTDQPGPGVWIQTDASPRFDCCDTDDEAHPNQTLFFSRARTGCGGFDFNCSNNAVEIVFRLGTGLPPESFSGTGAADVLHTDILDCGDVAEAELSCNGELVFGASPATAACGTTNNGVGQCFTVNGECQSVVGAGVFVFCR